MGILISEIFLYIDCLLDFIDLPSRTKESLPSNIVELSIEYLASIAAFVNFPFASTLVKFFGSSAEQICKEAKHICVQNRMNKNSKFVRKNF